MTSSSVPVPGSSHSAVQEALLREQFGSPEPRRDADGTAVLRGRFGFPPEPPGVLSPGSGARSPPPHGMMSPPPPGVLSPGGLDRAMYDCEAVGQHLEQLAFYRAPTSAGYVHTHTHTHTHTLLFEPTSRAIVTPLLHT